MTINAGTGDDVIVLGENSTNNLIEYKAGDGNDKIVGFNESSTLQIGDGKGTYSLTKSGNNLIITVDDSKITLVGAANISANIEGKKINKEPSTKLTVTDKTTSPLKIGSNIKTVNAVKRTKAIKITGNSLNNVILGSANNDTIYGESGNDSIVGNAGNDKLYGGFGKDTLKGGDDKDVLNGGAGNDKLYGGKGNDTLIGGTGNDSLWGDAGADTFIYNSGDGKDIIFGFDSKDTLTLDIDDFKATYKNKAVTLTFDEGSITLKDFTAKTFHINNDIYKISGSKLKKQ